MDYTTQIAAAKEAFGKLLEDQLKRVEEMKAQGTYDWKAFLYERYLPIVEEKVRTLSQKDYADDIVYCIFNECDNGVWFGDYNEEGEENFYEAWKITYELVKSIDPDAKIGGPGYFDYVTEKIDRFLIMIYHELNFWCSVEWPAHVEDYRRIEKEKGIAALPIIVTEYGTMDECGNPAAMVRYIVSMEKTNTYGDMAFWRLSNNLNDTCADDNSPNSNWWLYRKYAEMEGETLAVSTSALDSDSLFDNDWWYHYTGMASLSPDGKEIKVICNGSDNKKAVKTAFLSLVLQIIFNNFGGILHEQRTRAFLVILLRPLTWGGHRNLLTAFSQPQKVTANDTAILFAKLICKLLHRLILLRLFSGI